MGCDIHIVVENLWNDEWVGVPTPKVPDNRDYVRFTALADVRSVREKGPEPKGLPDDASPLARMQFVDDGDLHSHSWWTLREFVEICLANERDPERMLDPNDDRSQDPYHYYFGLHGEDIILERWRVVFCFDN